MSSLPDIVLPGQPMGMLNYIKGPGSYSRPDGITVSSLVGRPVIEDDSNSFIIQRPSNASSTGINVLPCINDIVLAKVTRINPRQATVQILVVGNKAVKDEFQGLIRLQDVRQFEKDKVKIYTSYRPGDIVRAQVISLGDQNHYYLSTAKNELGVIFATSDTGETMVPRSWKEMQWSGGIEERKVAKPI